MSNITRRVARRLAVILSVVLALSVVATPAFAAKGGDGGSSSSKSESPGSADDAGSKSEGKSGDSGAPEKDNDGDADQDPDTAYTEDDDTVDDEGEGTVEDDVADDDDDRHPSGKDRSVEGPAGNQGKAESTPDQDGKGPDRDEDGTDKPNGTGGIDESDQDGNNGCGNDDDFEDDNEGWCGKPDRDRDDVTVGGGSQTCPDGDMNGDRPGCGHDDEEEQDVTTERRRDRGRQLPEGVDGRPVESDVEVRDVVLTRPAIGVPTTSPVLARGPAPAAEEVTEVLGVVFERPAPAATAPLAAANATLAAPGGEDLPRTGTHAGLGLAAALALLGAGAATVRLVSARD